MLQLYIGVGVVLQFYIGVGVVLLETITFTGVTGAVRGSQLSSVIHELSHLYLVTTAHTASVSRIAVLRDRKHEIGLLVTKLTTT